MTEVPPDMFIEGYTLLGIELVFYDIAKRIVLGHRHNLSEVVGMYSHLFTMWDDHDEIEGKFRRDPQVGMVRYLFDTRYRKNPVVFNFPESESPDVAN
jgi:hypothetical protein